jgi:hypothetical protein
MVLDGNDDESDVTEVGWGGRGRNIRMATYGGASIATFRGWDGLTYVVGSDADPEQVTNFLNAAFPH